MFKLVAILAFMVTGAWAILKPGWDSICAALAALVTVISAFMQKGEPTQSQTVGSGGVGIQAGRDVSNHDISSRG